MKKGMATIWVVIITVVISAAAAAGGWYYLDLQHKKDVSALQDSITDLQKQISNLENSVSSSVPEDADAVSSASSSGSSTSASSTADPYLYANSKYGFSLQFNSKWEGYKIKTATNSSSTATYYVCLPTSDSGYAKATSTSLAGTASLFAFSVYSQAQWTAATAEEGVTPTKIGEAGDWIVGYSSAQAYPGTSVFSAAGSDVKNVVATFKTL